MNKKELMVPKGTEFISDWKDYVIPVGHCIVDKGVTGCGYTEMCLRNDLNVILCSPRKLLLKNKKQQHLADTNILYLENEGAGWEKEKERIENEISYHITKCQQEGKAVKFLITYDSAHYLTDYLSFIQKISNFYVVVDEFQVIFTDSFMKADTENRFVKVLQKCPNVIYLSATPMLEKYLNLIDEFKDLDYQKLDWSESGYVENIKLYRKRTNSLYAEAGKIIQQYLNNNFPVLAFDDKTIIQSKEAVFFFNSVNEIVKIIRNNNLTADQCNIICAADEKNYTKISKLGPKFTIGEIPIKGEPNKMFTFCTATSYIGADFYSDNASTFIFADPNLKNLALDISLDLPQIAGRQRNKNNPFKNNITIFYKTLRSENIESRDEFDKIQNERRDQTRKLLSAYEILKNNSGDNGLAEAFIKKISETVGLNNYSNDFLGISSGIPVYNKFIEIANERAWEVAQKDYQDSINVTKALSELKNVENYQYRDDDDKILSDFLTIEFFSTGIFAQKLKVFCDFMDKYRDNEYIMKTIQIKISDPKYLSYYNFFGTKICKSKKYCEETLKHMLSDAIDQDSLRSRIISEFMLGGKYTRKNIKERLAIIYKTQGILKTPKANDIEEYFETKPAKITDTVTGKRDHGYELLALKKIENEKGKA